MWVVINQRRRCSLLGLFAMLVSVTTLATEPAPQGFSFNGHAYGRVNLSLVDGDEPSLGQQGMRLNSNSSWLGAVGSSAVSDSLRLFYQVEFGICIDDGDCDGDRFTQRNSFIGLEGKWGRLLAGRHDTPTKRAARRVDAFNQLEGDIKHSFEGENRLSNVLYYTSPSWRNLTARLMLVAAEGADVDGDGRDENNLQGRSASLVYQRPPWFLALTADSHIDQQQLFRLLAKYQLGPASFGVMVQRNRDSQDQGLIDEQGVMLNAVYGLGEGYSLKLQYAELSEKLAGNDEQSLSLGLDRQLTKQARVYAFFTENTDRDNGEKYRDRYLGLGLDHRY